MCVPFNTFPGVVSVHTFVICIFGVHCAPKVLYKTANSIKIKHLGFKIDYIFIILSMPLHNDPVPAIYRVW